MADRMGSLADLSTYGDDDPYADAPGVGLGTAPQGNVAGSLASIAGGLGQRAVDWWQAQPSWSDRMAAAQAGTDPTRLSGGVDPTAQLDALGGLVGSTTPKAGIRPMGSLADVAAYGKAAEPAVGGAMGSFADVAPTPSITAYHGSPHDFEAFDTSKIGTGEGAQAYGHGLYFAGNENVAQSYKAAGQPSYLGADRISAAQQVFKDAGGDRAAALNLAQAKMAGTTKYSEGKLWQDVINNFDDLTGKTPGKMYEVNIAADPEHFLDWDKPLSEQSEHVRAAYQKLTGALDPAESAAKVQSIQEQMTALAEDRDPVTNQMRNESEWHKLARDRDAAWKQWNTAQSGGNFLQDFERNAARESYAIADPNGLLRHWPSTATTKADAIAEAGGDASRVKVIRTPDRSVASTTLRDAGIPGIKYLDQGSRNVGSFFTTHQDDGKFYTSSYALNKHEGPFDTRAQADANTQAKNSEGQTHNYVVFNDKLIQIARKYGLGALVAGGAAHFTMPQAQASEPLPARFGYFAAPAAAGLGALYDQGEMTR